MSGNHSLANAARTAETERVRSIWEKEAPRYDQHMRFIEKIFFGNGREWVCSQAEGNVLEVAIGTGRNLPFYPGGVRLTGVDISSAMLEIARERAAELGREVGLREADAQDLPFPDGSFDTVICTLSLCNIPDDHRAIVEMKRVLRPGGQLLLLDHICSSSRFVRALQRVLEVLTVRFEGDHLLRRPLEQVLVEGFWIERRERYKWGIVERLKALKAVE